MATKLPRLNVTVTPEQHALLLELGRLQGRSAASYLRQLLDQAEPLLAALVPIHRQAAQDVATMPERLQEAVRTALLEADAQRAQLGLLDHLAMVVPATANDAHSGLPAATPSVAREDAGVPRRASRKRS